LKRFLNFYRETLQKKTTLKIHPPPVSERKPTAQRGEVHLSTNGIEAKREEIRLKLSGHPPVRGLEGALKKQLWEIGYFTYLLNGYTWLVKWLVNGLYPLVN